MRIPITVFSLSLTLVCSGCVSFKRFAADLKNEEVTAHGNQTITYRNDLPDKDIKIFVNTTNLSGMPTKVLKADPAPLPERIYKHHQVWLDKSSVSVILVTVDPDGTERYYTHSTPGEVREMTDNPDDIVYEVNEKFLEKTRTSTKVSWTSKFAKRKK